MKMPSEDSKAAKKEEIEDEDEINLGSLKKKKPNNATPTQAKAKKVKKEAADDDFQRPSSKKSANKPSDKVGFRLSFYSPGVFVCLSVSEYFFGLFWFINEFETFLLVY